MCIRDSLCTASEIKCSKRKRNNIWSRRHMREKLIIKYPEKSLRYFLPQTLAQKINNNLPHLKLWWILQMLIKRQMSISPLQNCFKARNFTNIRCHLRSFVAKPPVGHEDKILLEEFHFRVFCSILFLVASVKRKLVLRSNLKSNITIHCIIKIVIAGMDTSKYGETLRDT